MTTNTPKKRPPAQAKKSLQFEFFGKFITNDESKVSNAIELWEGIPKYFFTPRQVEKLRLDNGLAEPFKWEYTRNNILCAVKIQPALIEQKDGSYKAFFPGVTEELVEESLKKISADGKHAVHDADSVETWVAFTLKLIQKELQAVNRTRSSNEIKHAIEVMSSCVLTYYENGKEVWKGAILQDLVTVGREDYLADTSAEHVARLPLFISLAINRMQNRQFNYPMHMSFDGQLSRWIHKQLVHRYKQASLSNSYNFMYSGLKASGLLQQATEDKNRNKAEDALNELIKKGNLARWTKDVRREGRRIVDIKYVVYPSPSFIGEQKAANKRTSEQQMLALQSGTVIVDN